MSILSGKVSVPRRVLIYGEAGLGKSTFASTFPKPVFLPTEEGINDIEVDHFPVAKTFLELKGNLNELYAIQKKDQSYKTLVIDSADWLEKLIWQHLVLEAKNPKITSVESFPYGSGYKLASQTYKDLLTTLDRSFRSLGFHIVFVAHSIVENFNDPEAEAYSRYIPALHKSAYVILNQWVDEIFFVRTQVSSVKSAAYEARRMLYTTTQPTHIAKNRLGLQNEYEFTRTIFSDHFSQFYQ